MTLPGFLTEPCSETDDTITQAAPSYTDVESGDKGLKRKFLERGTSQGPAESADLSQESTELKRPRDDAEKNNNPRETKRPSPPPEPKPPKSPKKAPSATIPKLASSSLIYCPLLYKLFINRADS